MRYTEDMPTWEHTSDYPQLKAEPKVPVYGYLGFVPTSPRAAVSEVYTGLLMKGGIGGGGEWDEEASETDREHHHHRHSPNSGYTHGFCQLKDGHVAYGEVSPVARSPPGGPISNPNSNLQTPTLQSSNPTTNIPLIRGSMLP